VVRDAYPGRQSLRSFALDYYLPAPPGRQTVSHDDAQVADLARACPRSERLEKLCRKLYRNANKLTDSFDKVRDKVRVKDAIERFWYKP